MKLNKIFIIVSALFLNYSSYAFSYHYEVNKSNGHIIHIVTLSTDEYKASIVKASNSLCGRQTVPAIGVNAKADIAINGGFFEIGKGCSGRPSGTLVINDKIYGLRKGLHSVVMVDNPDGAVEIKSIHPKNLSSGKNSSKNKLYLPKELSENISMVSGIPLLIEEGEIVSSLKKRISSFYTLPHARTAIGLKKDGTIILVIAENSYKNKMNPSALNKIKTLIDSNIKTSSHREDSGSGKKDLPNYENLITTKFDSENDSIGLTILELAKLMKNLGCETALNLDGGGSSTLWIEGKVINNVIGDKDEGNGLKKLRPVSDAIVFRKKYYKR